MSTNGSAPTIVEHLRGGMQELIATAVAREARAHSGISDDELTALAKGLVPFLREFVAEALSPLIARNAVCEQRIAELEGQLDEIRKTMLVDAGVFTLGRFYEKGAVVSSHGAPWAAQKPTNAKPGTSDDWRLIGKSHR